MQGREKSGVIVSIACIAIVFGSLLPAEGQAALEGRAPLTPGGTDYRAYYDTVLDITWLADANLAATTTFGVTGIGSNGVMNWSKANEWIAAMNVAGYLGKGNWRLPRVTDTGAVGCNFGFTGTDCGYNVNPATGEMAHLYYSTLGNGAVFDTSGGENPCSEAEACLTNAGPFANLLPVTYELMYWYGTDYAPNVVSAWRFSFLWGEQFPSTKSAAAYAWAVSAGDVPSPPALGAGVSDRVTTVKGVAVPVSVLANDLDFSSPSTVGVASAPAHGGVVVTGSPGGPGAVLATYTPAAGFAGTDSFIYSVTDGTSSDTATVYVTVLPDADGDGVADAQDNCIALANAIQADSDNDGYGNLCDGDLNNNGVTNAQDYVLFRQQLGQPSTPPTYNVADLNGNGSVNAQDYVLFRQRLGVPSGPSVHRGSGNSYTVTGTVSGLTGSGLVLRNNGGDNLNIYANGPFVFPTALAGGGAYNVTVLAQPTSPSQTCVPTSGGSGSANTGALPNVAITCTTNSFTVGGTVSALIGAGLQLQNRSAENVAVPGNGSYAFPTPLLSGAKYEVKATSQPGGPAQTCSVANATGTVGNGNVTNANASCAINGDYFYSAGPGNVISIYRVDGYTWNGQTYDPVYNYVGTQPTGAYPTSAVGFGGYLYVTNAGPDTVSQYSINWGTGALTLLATYPTGPNPSLIAFAAPGKLFPGPPPPALEQMAWVSGDGSIMSFRVGAGGVLTPVGSPVEANGCPDRMDFYWSFEAGDPQAGNYALLWECGSNPHLYSYQINNDGSLAFRGWNYWGGPNPGDPPSPTPPTISLPYVVDPSCDYGDPDVTTVYEANPSANTVSKYQGDDPCNNGNLNLTLVATYPAGPQPVDVLVYNGFAYVVNAGDNTLSVYDLSGGGFIPVGTPVSTGPGPVSVERVGSVLYVVNGGDNTVSTYDIDPVTGLPVVDYVAQATVTLTWGGGGNGASTLPVGRTIAWTSNGANSLTSISNTSYFTALSGSNVSSYLNPDFAEASDYGPVNPDRYTSDDCLTPLPDFETIDLRKYGCRHWDTDEGDFDFNGTPVSDAGPGASATGTLQITDTTMTGTLTVVPTTDEPGGGTTTVINGVNIGNSTGDGADGYNVRWADGSPFGNVWYGVSQSMTLTVDFTGTFTNTSWEITGGTVRFSDPNFACQQGGLGGDSRGILCTPSTTGGGFSADGSHLSWGMDTDGAGSGAGALAEIEIRDAAGTTVLGTLSGVLATLAIDAGGNISTNSGEFRSATGSAGAGCPTSIRYDGTKVSCGTLSVGPLDITGTVLP